MRPAAVAIVVGVMSLWLAAEAPAQWVLPPPPPPFYTAETPARELSVSVQLWSLDRGGVGGRWTRNFNKWFAWEASLDGGRHNEWAPGYLIGVTNVRWLLRGPDTTGLFVTAGVGGGSGMDYTVSPVVGAGLQGGWAGGAVALRGEIQRFTRGRAVGQSGRLVLSLVIAIPD